MKKLWSYDDFYNCIPLDIRDKIEAGTVITNEYDEVSKAIGFKFGEEQIFARFYYEENIIDFEEDTVSHPTLIGCSEKKFIEPKLIDVEDNIDVGIQNYIGPLIIFNTTVHGYYFIENDGNFYNYTYEIWDFVNKMGIDYANMTDEDYSLIKIFLLGRP